MPYTAILMLAVLPFVILSVFAGIDGLSPSDYDRATYDRAKSDLYVSGRLPDNPEYPVYGRNVPVNSSHVDNSSLGRAIEDSRGWRKAMAEQAMINTCLYLQAKCGKEDINLLWAFLPQPEGDATDILKDTSPSFDCSTATDTEYGKYGRHILKQAIPEALLHDSKSGKVMVYSKPSQGVGCAFQDLVRSPE